MSLSSIENSYMMEYLFKARAAQKTADTAFATTVRKIAVSSTTENYLAQLEARFGPIRVQSVGKDQDSMDRLGASSCGTGNVAIAPNILEQMATDPKKAAYYEEKIQYHFDSLPKLHADLALMGHEVHSCGVVIHEDGTVTYYVSGDLKPEVRARIEAQIEKEQAEKAARRQMYADLRQEAAEGRRIYVDLQTEHAALREQLAAMADEWKADSSLRHLLLWSEALQSARKGAPPEQKSLWDILFTNRAENHEAAMELSRRLRAASVYENPLTAHLYL